MEIFYGIVASFEASFVVVRAFMYELSTFASSSPLAQHYRELYLLPKAKLNMHLR